jgi:hypothetical protein
VSFLYHVVEEKKGKTKRGNPSNKNAIEYLMVAAGTPFLPQILKEDSFKIKDF